MCLLRWSMVPNSEQFRAGFRALQDLPAPPGHSVSIDGVVDFNRGIAMETGKQNRWNRSTGNDTLLNSVLLGAAVLLVVAQVISGNFEGQMPGHEAVAAATAASAAS
jgi:hypothetical protein